jgi:hypothetical protein
VTPTRQAYVTAVVRNYVRLPGTPLLASRRDRQIAGLLHDRGLPLRFVWAAFVLAAARWAFRRSQPPKLPRIRTLSYFLPAIDEVLDTPPDPGYIAYLAIKLRPLVQQKEAELLSSSANAPFPDAPPPRSESRVS